MARESYKEPHIFTESRNDPMVGIFEGIVEDNTDPHQMGRLRVRDYHKHADPASTETTELEWMEPCLPFAGGSGYGTIVVPPVGSHVYYTHLYGDDERPIWIGSRSCVTNRDDHSYLRNPAQDFPSYAVNMSPDPKIVWQPDRGPEVPKEYLRMRNLVPDRMIIFKSVKGASVDIEERDNHERVNVHDRLGQTIFIEGNVGSEYGTDLTPGNERNHAQRHLRSGNDGSQLPLESTYAKEASINLIDLSGQHITLNTDVGDNTVQIISKECYKDPSGTIASNKELPGTKSVTLELSSSDNQFVVEVRNKNELKGKIRIDGLTGTIEIETTNMLNIKAQNISIDGDVDINGNLSVSKNIITPESNLFTI